MVLSPVRCFWRLDSGANTVIVDPVAILKRSLMQAYAQQQSRWHHPAGAMAAPRLGSECNTTRWLRRVAAWSVF